MAVPWNKSCGLALPTVEREWLRMIATRTAMKFKDPVFVNIGVFRCASMYCLRAGAHEARIIGVDVKSCPVPIDPGLRAEFLIADSRECHTQVTVPIHLLFLDGDHHYEVVRVDICNWTPKIIPGGFVVFHDYAPLAKDLVKNPYLEGVRRAVDEWQAESSWEKVEAVQSLCAFRRPK